MKLKKLSPDDRMRNFGLTFKEMSQMKQVVALFGRNGSGKSRLLGCLPAHLSRLASDANAINRRLSNLAKTEDSHKIPDHESLWTLQKEMQEKIDPSGGFLTLENTTTVLSHSGITDEEYGNMLNQVLNHPDFNTVRAQCVKLIKALCRSHLANEIGQKIDTVIRSSSTSRYNELFLMLKDLVGKIMNKDLSYETDGNLTPIVLLDDRPFILEELSAGEKELLAYCTYLTIQQWVAKEFSPELHISLSLEGKLLIIDEPEQFLHPEAQIDLVNGLRKAVGPNGQIWIATHSLAILSTLDREEIWLMENGNVTPPGIETPNRVLNSLIGEENLDNLENFLSSQYEWAAIQFAFECLTSPTVVPFKARDPQLDQATEPLNDSKVPLRVLDFGAGKGRIGQEILRNPDTASLIYYQPLEICSDFQADLRKLSSDLQLLSEIEPEIEREVLDTHEKLKESQYKNFFDRILLVNVLHEISPSKWVTILNVLLDSLSKDGKLLILEDQALPRGENAHEFGFVILDREELKSLFKLKNPPESTPHPDKRYAERLTCIEIPKAGSQVTTESVKESLSRKKTNCKLKINELRTKSFKTAADGRRNSFLTQLYANVDMALSDLPNN